MVTDVPFVVAILLNMLSVPTPITFPSHPFGTSTTVLCGIG